MSNSFGTEAPLAFVNANIGQIASQKPTSRGSTSNIDLYTYVPNAESGNTNSHGNIQETQPAENILETMKQSAVRKETGLQMHASYTPMPGPSSAPIYHVSAPELQPYHAPPPPSRVFDCAVDMQDGFDKLATANPGNPLLDFPLKCTPHLNARAPTNFFPHSHLLLN
jgi:hypothetical protein